MLRIHTGFLLALLAAALASCGSFLQPSISDRKTAVAPAPAAAPEPVAQPSASAAVAAPFALPPPAEAAAVTCARTKGHAVYYANSRVELRFDCGVAVAAAAATGAPAFLALASSGTTVTVTGTAPAAASTASWSLTVNGAAVLGAGAAIATRVITSTPTVTLKAPGPDVAGNYGAAVAVAEGDFVLDPLWDGAASDVTVSLLPSTAQGADTPGAFDGAAFAAADADAAGLRFVADCATATGTYVCPQPTVGIDAHTFGGSGLLRWTWSPFDQGSYEISVRPYLDIEGAPIRLPSMKVPFVIPRQAFGSVPLATSASPRAADGLDDRRFSYAFARNAAASSPAAPVFGVGYESANADGTGNKKSWLTRVALDRSVSPLAALPSGLTQAVTPVDLTGPRDSMFHRLRTLANGAYVSLAVVDGELTFSRVADDPTAPALAAGMPITISNLFAGSYDFKGAAMTEPFTDTDGVTRIGVAYATRDGIGNDVLGIGKINPAGTALTGGAPSLSDDPDFMTTDADFNVSSLFEHDNVEIAAGTRLGARALFVAHRLGTEVQVGYVLSNKNAMSGLPVYAFRSLTSDLGLVPATFSGAGAGNAQSLSMALGVKGVTPVIGVAWRDQDTNDGGAPRCFFRRIDAESLAGASRSDVLPLTAGECREPRLAFNAATGRYLVTYGEKVGGNWQISSREIALGSSSTDTPTAAVSVVQLGAAAPVKLETAYDPAGAFVGILFRVQGDDAVRVHGYHVAR